MCYVLQSQLFTYSVDGLPHLHRTFIWIVVVVASFIMIISASIALCRGRYALVRKILTDFWNLFLVASLIVNVYLMYLFMGRHRITPARLRLFLSDPVFFLPNLFSVVLG